MSRGWGEGKVHGVVQRLQFELGRHHNAMTPKVVIDMSCE